MREAKVLGGLFALSEGVSSGAYVRSCDAGDSPASGVGVVIRSSQADVIDEWAGGTRVRSASCCRS